MFPYPARIQCIFFLYFLLQGCILFTKLCAVNSAILVSCWSLMPSVTSRGLLYTNAFLILIALPSSFKSPFSHPVCSLTYFYSNTSQNGLPLYFQPWCGFNKCYGCVHIILFSPLGSDLPTGSGSFSELPHHTDCAGHLKLPERFLRASTVPRALQLSLSRFIFFSKAFHPLSTITLPINPKYPYIGSSFLGKVLAKPFSPSPRNCVGFPRLSSTFHSPKHSFVKLSSFFSYNILLNNAFWHPHQTGQFPQIRPDTSGSGPIEQRM